MLRSTPPRQLLLLRFLTHELELHTLHSVIFSIVVATVDPKKTMTGHVARHVASHARMIKMEIGVVYQIVCLSCYAIYNTLLRPIDPFMYEKKNIWLVKGGKVW